MYSNALVFKVILSQKHNKVYINFENNQLFDLHWIWLTNKAKYEFWGSRVARKRLGRNSSVGAFPLAFAWQKYGAI